MKMMPYGEDLSIPVIQTNWKDLSILDDNKEEKDCIEGLSTSSGQSCSPQFPKFTPNWVKWTSWSNVIWIYESNK
jgi:hypothetical protein